MLIFFVQYFLRYIAPFLFLAFFSLIRRVYFEISYVWNMSIDIIERFYQRVAGRRRDKYVSKHDDRAIYYSVGGKGSPSCVYFDRR